VTHRLRNDGRLRSDEGNGKRRKIPSLWKIRGTLDAGRLERTIFSPSHESKFILLLILTTSTRLRDGAAAQEGEALALPSLFYRRACGLFRTPILPRSSVRSLDLDACEIVERVVRALVGSLRGHHRDDGTPALASPLPLSLSLSLSLVFDLCILGPGVAGVEAAASRPCATASRLERLRMDDCVGVACRSGSAATLHPTTGTGRSSPFGSSPRFMAATERLDGVLGHGSTTLRRLHVSPPNPWEEEEDGRARPYGALPQDVIRLLKTNVVLESFTVETRPSRRLFFEDDEADGLDALRRSHNFTLRNVVQSVANPPLSDDPPGRTSAQEGRINRLLDRKPPTCGRTMRGPCRMGVGGATCPPAHGTAVLRLGPEIDPAVQRLPHPHVPVPPSPPGLAWGGGRPPWRRQRTRGGGPKVVRTCKGGVVAPYAT
jgi:hypothetical protein